MRNNRSVNTSTDCRRRGRRGEESVCTPKRRTQRHRPPSPPPHERGNSMWQSYGPWRYRWRACLQAGSRRALSFLHPAPRDKKKRERDRGEERPKKRRAPAPSASPVSFKSDKCAVGNMTEKNNAKGLAEESRLPKGLKRSGIGRESPIGAREIEKLISAPGGRLFRIVSDARLPGGCLWRD